MAIKKRFPYKAAFVACNGGCRATADCQYGCVGCELCVNACKFEAIALNDYGVAEVNEDKCIACGKCVRIRGTLDTQGVAGRNQARSKYGAKRPKAGAAKK